MTPKEKAEQLYKKHYAVSQVSLIAKMGAVVTINEMLSVLVLHNAQKYWKEVKEELEKL